jgi:hypothetical protein
MTNIKVAVSPNLDGMLASGSESLRIGENTGMMEKWNFGDQMWNKRYPFVHLRTAIT